MFTKTPHSIQHGTKLFLRAKIGFQEQKKLYMEQSRSELLAKKQQILNIIIHRSNSYLSHGAAQQVQTLGLL